MPKIKIVQGPEPGRRIRLTSKGFSYPVSLLSLHIGRQVLGIDHAHEASGSHGRPSGIWRVGFDILFLVSRFQIPRQRICAPEIDNVRQQGASAHCKHERKKVHRSADWHYINAGIVSSRYNPSAAGDAVSHSCSQDFLDIVAIHIRIEYIRTSHEF